MTMPSSLPSPLVGRDRELGTLRERLAATCAGQGGLVLIGGEAGIGKSTLAEALCREAAEQGARVLVGRCYDRTETPPYGPFRELFQQYEPAHGLPPLPVVFSRWGVIGMTANQSALFDQVRDFLASLAAVRPVMLLLDDLHWADQTSLDLLRALARSIRVLPLLLLATYRADELTRYHPLHTLLPLLEREAAATRIALRPLSVADVTVLVAARYALPVPETARLVDYLDARAEGNALFVTQLLRALEEEGVLARSADRWELGDLNRLGVPMPLMQVIDARVGRLGEEAQALLAVAAVIGQEAPLALWAGVATVTEDAILSAVEQAVAARLVEALPDGETVRFVHALIREALYESMLPPRRRRWHRKVGDVLITVPAVDPDTVAYHFRQGGDARAAEWLVRAGTRARLSHAFATAQVRYETALAQMERDAAPIGERGWVAYLLATTYYYTAPERGVATLDAAIRDAMAAGDRALETMARFQRGLIINETTFSLGGLDEMVAAVRILETFAPDETERVRGYLGPHHSLDDDRAAVARHLAVVGRFAEVLPLAESLVRDGHDRRTHAYAVGAWALAIVSEAHGQPDTARIWRAQARAVYAAAQMYVSLLSVLTMEIESVHLTYAADEPAEGERLLREVIQFEELASGSGIMSFSTVASLPFLVLHGDWSVAQSRAAALAAASHTEERSRAMRCLAMLAWHRGERHIAAQYVAEMLPAGPGTEPGVLRLYDTMQAQRLAIAMVLNAGNLPEANAWLKAHDRWLAWSGTVVGASEGQALWAQYHRQAGALKQARAHAERALLHATEPRQPLALLAAHRLRGELDTDAGQYNDAAHHLQQSLALAEACRAPYERALTLLAMAKLHAERGERDAATRLLDDVRGICGSLGANPTLARANALTARLTTTPNPLPAHPAGLTEREVAVLRLVAAGLSNAAVAERLFVSPRTINGHLTNIYGKLGVASRGAAIRFALDHDLR